MTISMTRRLRALAVLAAIYSKEMVRSSVVVARTAFSRHPQVSPAIIAVPIVLRTDFGISALANLVSLTPGTTSLHVSDDRSTLYVHCLDAPSAEQVVAEIKDTFERYLQEIEG
jgi:multicomponent Na+:H+ antiporter subunit E